MAVRTNRVPGEVVEASDLNAIAQLANSNEARVGDALAVADADATVAGYIDDPASATSSALAVGSVHAAEDVLEALAVPPYHVHIPAVSSSATSTITSSPVDVFPAVIGGGVQVNDWDGRTAPTEPNFFFHGGLFETGNGPNGDIEVHPEVLPGGSSQAAFWTMTVEFNTSSVAELELIFWAPSNEDILIEVNGVVAGYYRLQNISGNWCYMRLAFPMALSRHIRFSTGFSRFRGVRLPTGGSVSKPEITTRRVGAIIGDSWVAGSGSGTLPGLGTSRVTTYARGLLRAMGANDFVHAGIGATGIVAAPYSNNYITRVSAVLARNPDFLIIQGSINDYGKSPAEIQAALEDLLVATDTVTERYVMTIPKGGFTENTAIRAAVQNHPGVHLVEMENTFHGTGNILGGTPNYNQFLLSDNSHISYQGHRLLVRRAFRQISPLLG